MAFGIEGITALVIASMICIRGSCNFTIFGVNSVLDNHVCSDSSNLFVVNGQCRNSQQCLYLCIQHPGCYGVFYDTKHNKCTGCTDDIDNELAAGGLIQAAFTEFYFRKSRSHGAPCFQRSVCGPNQYCGFTNMCICQSGYSYDPSSASCVEQCASYGDTYEEHPGVHITGLNILTYYDTTAIECKELCSAESSCRTCDRHTKSGTCNLQMATALTDPDRFMAAATTHYQRNCA